jgi:hypothetical protein
MFQKTILYNRGGQPAAQIEIWQIFRYFGRISPVFCKFVSQKFNIFDKISVLRHTERFGLATSGL